MRKLRRNRRVADLHCHIVKIEQDCLPIILLHLPYDVLILQLSLPPPQNQDLAFLLDCQPEAILTYHIPRHHHRRHILNPRVKCE
jgi:hypothetical protein